MRRRLISPGLPLVLAAIGMTGLTISWVRQNGELVRANEDIFRLQRSQLVIDSDEIARDQWLIALDQEIAKEKPDAEFLVVAAHGAIEGFLRWESHMEGRVAESPEQYKKELAARDTLLAQVKKLAEVKNYRSLMAFLQKLTEMSHNLQTTTQLDNQFSSAIGAANNKLREIEGSVRFWYLFGTALLLLSSISASVLLERTLRRIEIKIPQATSHTSNKRK